MCMGGIGSSAVERAEFTLQSRISTVHKNPTETIFQRSLLPSTSWAKWASAQEEQHVWLRQLPLSFSLASRRLPHRNDTGSHPPVPRCAIRVSGCSVSQTRTSRSSHPTSSPPPGAPGGGEPRRAWGLDFAVKASTRSPTPVGWCSRASRVRGSPPSFRRCSGRLAAVACRICSLGVAL